MRQPGHPNAPHGKHKGQAAGQRAPEPTRHSPWPILEVPIFNRASVLPAINAGCRRIELNATGSYAVGGTTPSLQLIRAVVSDLDSLPFPVPLRIMIRPRGGNFVYTDQEQAQIKASIAEIKPLLKHDRGDGFVFGALMSPKACIQGKVKNGTVDRELCLSVHSLCRPFPVVFHRAFDEVVGAMGPWWEVASQYSVLPEVGLKGILTSGGPGNAVDNLTVVRRIVKELTCEDEMEVIVGGGLRSGNVRELYHELRDGTSGKRVVYHSSCLKDPAGSSEEVDVDEVRRIVGVLQERESP